MKLKAKDFDKRHDDGSSTVERQAIVDGRGREIVADVDDLWRSRIITAVNSFEKLLEALKFVSTDPCFYVLGAVTQEQVHEAIEAALTEPR